MIECSRPTGRGFSGVCGECLSLVLASGAFAASRPQIHPFAQQATLTASDEIGDSGLGSRRGLSSDGNTVLIGGPDDTKASGAVWVFTRRGAPPGPSRAEAHRRWGDRQRAGSALGVALSSDGKTALIGGPGDSNGLGAAWVSTRSGLQPGGSATQTHEARGEIGEGRVRNERGASSNGNTALIGGPQDNES